jgi:hypothetical protein
MKWILLLCCLFSTGCAYHTNVVLTIEKDWEPDLSSRIEITLKR